MTARRATELAAKEAKVAQQTSEELVQMTSVAQKAAENTERPQNEGEELLNDGMQPVTVPTPHEVAAAKLKVQYQEGLFHFAVTGTVGSGKSTLVNALRGLENKDSNAARTGVVETTLTIGRYPDPDPQRPLVWYDIPGAGTWKQPDSSYFNAHGLFVFDCIIILFDNGFSETDVAILRNCRRFQIPTYIVRSKADVHIRNIMYDEGYRSDHHERTRYEAFYIAAQRRLIADTQESVRKNLENAGLFDQRVYIVSNKTLMSTVKGQPQKTIDELELMRDILKEASSRRCWSSTDAITTESST